MSLNKDQVPQQFLDREFWENVLPSGNFGKKASLGIGLDPFQINIKYHPAGPNEWGGGAYMTLVVLHNGDNIYDVDGVISRQDLINKLVFAAETGFDDPAPKNTE